MQNSKHLVIFCLCSIIIILINVLTAVYNTSVCELCSCLYRTYKYIIDITTYNDMQDTCRLLELSLSPPADLYPTLQCQSQRWLRRHWYNLMSCCMTIVQYLSYLLIMATFILLLKQPLPINFNPQSDWGGGGGGGLWLFWIMCVTE